MKPAVIFTALLLVTSGCRSWFWFKPNYGKPAVEIEEQIRLARKSTNSYNYKEQGDNK